MLKRKETKSVDSVTKLWRKKRPGRKGCYILRRQQERYL